ncbi:hypothetical protein [Cytobacillus praedii]|uniref:hypothetical protein n=1 Tax=Cytobacillus praedii TaxID=1742358 RepID=UPI002E1FA188|nr:hypothetical protein [Cytobacillus praedii]
MEDLLELVIIFIIACLSAYFFLKRAFKKKIEDMRIIKSDLILLTFYFGSIVGILKLAIAIESFFSLAIAIVGFLFTAFIAGLQDLFNTVQINNSKMLEARINTIYLNLSKDYSVEPDIQDKIKRIESFVLLARSKIVDFDKEKAAVIDLDIALKLLANYQLNEKKKP